MGSAGVGLFISPPSGTGNVASGFGVPGGFREAFAGTLDAAHPGFDVPVSVFASSESMEFLVRPTGESSVTPALGMIKVFGPDGTALAEASPEFGPGDSPPQFLTVLTHGMPVGGRLVVQVMSAESSTSSETGTTAASAPSSGWSAPFVLYVQRQDDQVQAGLSVSGPPAQGSIATGILALPASAQAGVPSSSDGPATSVATGTSDTALTNQDEPPAVAAAPDESASDSSGGFNLRVPTGPFVSRTAGPLGPILASVGGDPTPEVDRNERALFQEIERRDVDQGTDRNDKGFELARREPAGTRSDESDGRVRAVSGAGGLPFEVTGLASRRRTDLSALLASIPPAAAMGEPGDEPAETPHWIDTVHSSAIAEATLRSAVPVYSDFIKAACGLALGLGMSSRALFPDLLASVQMHVPRWLRERRARARK